MANGRAAEQEARNGKMGAIPWNQAVATVEGGLSI